MASFHRLRLVTFCLCFSLSSFLAAQADAGKPNVLFIAVDDLRPQLGCYGIKSI